MEECQCQCEALAAFVLRHLGRVRETLEALAEAREATAEALAEATAAELSEAGLGRLGKSGLSWTPEPPEPAKQHCCKCEANREQFRGGSDPYR